MTIIIDRRLNPRDKSSSNRQKFIARSKTQIKKAVKEAIDTGNISDIEKGKVKVKVKNISEPTFSTDPKTGDRKYILPGNKDFVVGDKQNKRKDGGGTSGREGDGSDEGEDDFEFVLEENEFLNFIFEELELPDLIKQKMKDVVKTKIVRSGFKSQGNPAQLDIIRSMKNGMGRRIGLRRPSSEEIEELEALIEFNRASNLDVTALLMELEELKSRKKVIPFLDPIDLRYRNFDLVPYPTTKAVMICMMDVSASMGQTEKDYAKRFFFLLHMFLKRKYDRVEIVYIRHHSKAREVDEKEFFYGTDTGGTVVSSALELAKKIIHERYNVNDWNIYCAHASDGDNSSSDEGATISLIRDLLALSQYYAYVEVRPTSTPFYMAAYFTTLWKTFTLITDKKLNIKKVSEISDIWKVFKELFKKERK